MKATELTNIYTYFKICPDNYNNIQVECEEVYLKDSKLFVKIAEEETLLPDGDFFLLHDSGNFLIITEEDFKNYYIL